MEVTIVMSTVQSKALTDSFLAFASQASQILHIHTNDDYENALELIEYLFDLADDSENDPLIFKALTSPRETIFSNVLISEGYPYWIGDGRTTPGKGVNFSGEWQKGKIDKKD